jgi:hypothetical protein
MSLDPEFVDWAGEPAHAAQSIAATPPIPTSTLRGQTLLINDLIGRLLGGR